MAAALLSLVIALLLTGCRDPLGAPGVPDEAAFPSVIGIVKGLEREPDGVLVELADGSSVLVPNGANDLTGSIELGRLVFYGESGLAGDNDGPWFAAIRSLPSGCYRVPVNGEVRDDRLALSLGFSVPLSEEWPENETETRFVNSPPVGFCLNEAGEADGTYANTRGSRSSPANP